MKTNKIIKIIAVLFFAVSNSFAQNNEMKAKIEYEDAETAFQNKEYDKVITYLSSAEKLLGRWTPKVSFLKIQALDIVTDYGVWSDNTAEIYRQIKEYMKYADKNPDKVDLDKMRELYEVEKRADAVKKMKDWKETPEYKNGQAAYEKENYEEAINWNKKAIEKDNPVAMAALAWYYKNGKGIEQSDEEAFNWSKKAVDKGVAVTMVEMGNILYTKGSHTEAMNWYKKAADKGIASAMSYIGNLYGNGQGVTKSYSEALHWLKKAADKEIVPSMNHIGTIYYNGGYGVTQDYGEALNWYKKAAGRGFVASMNSIGYMYHNGIGVKQDYLEAINWYKKAAEKGSHTASAWIGSFYYNGKGVSIDYDQALYWLKKTVEMNVPKEEKSVSFALVAHVYKAKKDYEQALQWYVKAHDAGHQTAKNEIALMYEQGLGVEKDKKMAKEWRSK